MMRVEVRPEVLHWAVEYSQKGADVFRKKFPRFDRWLSQTAQPTIKQLEELARFAHVPFGYLLLDHAPRVNIEAIDDFRTKRNHPVRAHAYSPELRDTILAIRARQDWLRDYKKQQDYAPVSLVECLDRHVGDANFVQTMREMLDIKEDWRAHIHSKDEAFRYVLEKVEAAGVVVFVSGVVEHSTSRKLNVNEFRGFALADPYAPAIFINGADAPAGRLFTLVHELVHIFLGQDSLDDGTEVFCNRIAGRFLVPETPFNEQWNDHAGDFDALETYFKVSKLVLYRAALNYGKITPAEYRRLTEEYDETVAKRRGAGGNFYNTLPYRMGRSFSRYVFESVREGTTPYTEAYRLLGLTGKTYAEALRRMEV